MRGGAFLVCLCLLPSCDGGGPATAVPGGHTSTTTRLGVSEPPGVQDLATAKANAIATDGARVFWSSGSPFPQSCGFPPCSTLNAVPVAGGAPEQLFVADPDAIAAGPVVDAKNVYFVVAHKSGPASLLSMPLSGGAPTVIQSGTFGGPMALGADHVVFMEWSLPHQMALARWSTTDASLSQLPLGDSTWSWITSVAADDTGLYWLQTGEASPVTGLHRASVDAPPNVALAGGTYIATTDGAALALDDAYVYVKSSVAVERITKDGKTTTTLATTTRASSSLADGTTGLAANGGYVYFSDDGAQTLCKVPREGGAVTVLAHTGWGVRAIVFDDTSVYWADNVGISKGTPK